MSVLKAARVFLLIFSVAFALTPTYVPAQAYSYPSLQLPTVSTRDYTAAIVGSNGAIALFQWRERIASDMHV
ncbi:MAG: hypothetical protein M3Y64_02130, partial [Gemmatimonadota bacterium]|nr:hypothetical protein [Gemmatimonadota bacterium]